jgi:hypothetical protein
VESARDAVRSFADGTSSKGGSKDGAGSVQNVYVLRMKRGDPIPKR